MKYFTMDELDEITREILENPSPETLKKLSDKYYGVSESHHEVNNTWIEDSNQEYTNTQFNEENISYATEPLWKPSQENSIENINIPSSSLDTVNSESINSDSFNIQPLRQEEDKNISFEVEEKNEVEPINNPILEIEPYSKQINSPSLDIQTPSIPKTQSLISELEEETNRQSSMLSSGEEEKKTLPLEEKIDIIPYREYIGSNGTKTENPFPNNSVINTPVPSNNISNIMPTPPVVEKTNNQVQTPVFSFENNLNTQDNIINNMMQTTDNFNTPIEASTSTNSYINNMSNNQNISIPIMQQNIPTYGQFDQKTNNNVAW